MSVQGNIRRYFLIIEKISRNKYIDFKSLKEYLFGMGFEVSTRTIQRDIEHIRFEFGLEIQYNRSQNGYAIIKNESTDFENFIRYLEIASTTELFTDSLKKSKTTLNHISFESQGELKGIRYLKPLLSAILNKHQILITHENFKTGEVTEYLIDPYLLKEYQNRWYVIGYVDEFKQFRTFGIDRILKIEQTKAFYKPISKINPLNFFDDVIGLTYSDAKVEEVILSFTHLQGKYIKALPLHKSQIILKDSDSELVVQLWIVPNYEFIQRLLMLGAGVQVQKPEWLRNEVKKTLLETLKLYD